MFKKYIKKIKRKIKVTIKYIVAIISFILRLFKIVIAEWGNNKTVNEILSLLKKEYELISSEKGFFRALREISNEKIPNKIEHRLEEFRDLTRFDPKIKKLKELLYWIKKLDKYGAILNSKQFMEKLSEDVIIMIKKKAETVKGNGTIEKDLKSLENTSGLDLDLVNLYEKTIKENQKIVKKKTNLTKRLGPPELSLNSSRT
jgi:hypothetical protein